MQHKITVIQLDGRVVLPILGGYIYILIGPVDGAILIVPLINGIGIYGQVVGVGNFLDAGICRLCCYLSINDIGNVAVSGAANNGIIPLLI